MAVTAGLALLCLLAACGKPSPPGPAAERRMDAKTVRLAAAENRPMPRVIHVTGTLAARERSVLSAKVPGRLQRLAVDVGSVVPAGAPLAQVEPRDYELGLAQATAALAQARTALGLAAEGEDDEPRIEEVSSVKQAKAVLVEATLNRERVANLFKAGIAAPADRDTAEAAYKVALTRHEAAVEDARARRALLAQRRAEFDLAAKRLADASLRAPYDGVVQARTASPGEYVAAGVPIVELIKTGPLRLRLQIPERECALVAAGQVVRLWVEGATNVFGGAIARLSPAVDEQTRMLVVEADVPVVGPLRPGLFARATIIVEAEREALSVPAESIVTFAGLEKVLVVRNGKALEKLVTTGRREAGWVEILSGLEAGEGVVLSPGGLRAGQPLMVENRDETRTTARASGPDKSSTPN
jgi:RND family efflux transporter MFP subunit